MGRNPATGEQIKIPARTAIKIMPAKVLKDVFNKKGKK
ncbi:MAG TPA: HU family DNA-binding protein [Anaeromyxobacteraceae bacterium]|nr:HU family DNA-binding protein [Anaeromyxobacteraceae bacterium]